MATIEVPGFLKYKDAEGNLNLLLPITTKDNVDGMDEIETALGETVRFTEQTLTEEQKAQARTNIGASDVSSWNDLTDKPFGEFVTVTIGDTLTWDGDTTGRPMIDADVSLYRVSDATPSETDLANGVTVIRTTPSGDVTMEAYVNNTGTMLVVYGDSGNLAYILPNAMGANPAGIYLACSGDGYVSAFTVNGYGNFQNTVTEVKTIDPKFLPDDIVDDESVHFTEQTLTEEQKAQARANIGANRNEINCKIIAHRGYHVYAVENTIAAFADAIEAGFSWIEIDINRCSDGTYIMSHNNAITLYNNGVPVDITITDTDYSDIKGYTWDAEGKYKLCTLQAVFNTMKVHDVSMICDRKTGKNSDIMQLAALCGVVDNVMLSYSSFSSAYSEKDLLNKYGNVPIRCVPSDYTNFEQLAAEVRNPIYADVNAAYADYYQQYLTTALSCGIPILFSGCMLGTTSRWAVLAAGCMAHENLNITPAEFLGELTNDFDTECTITLSKNYVEMATTETVSVTAESDLDAVSGYVYAYSTNPTVVRVTQKTFGKSTTIDITANETGNAEIVFFCGNGETKKLPIFVIEGENSFIWKLGTIEAAGNHGSSKDRACPMKAIGTIHMEWSPEGCIPEGYTGATLFLPTIPEGATLMTVPDHDSNIIIAPAIFDANKQRLADPGYNTNSIDLTKYPTAVYYSANVKHSSGEDFSVTPDDAEGYARYMMLYEIKDFIFT